MKKRILAMMAALILSVAMVGCSSTPNSTTGDGQPTVAPTTAPTDAATVEPTEATKVSKLDEIKQAGKLVMGTESHYAPYEFHVMVDGQDKIVGFDMDVAAEIAKDLGVTLVIEDMSFDALVPAIQAGNIDIALAGLTPTEERRATCDFSDIYYKAKQLVLVRAEDEAKYPDIASLAGKSVGAQRGSIQEGIVRNQFTQSDPVVMPKVPTLVMELLSGNIEAVVVEGPVAEQYVKQNSGKLVASAIPLDESEFEGGSAVMMPKDSPELVEAINATIKRITESGDLDKYVVAANELMSENTEAEPEESAAPEGSATDGADTDATAEPSPEPTAEAKK